MCKFEAVVPRALTLCEVARPFKVSDQVQTVWSGFSRYTSGMKMTTVGLRSSLAVRGKHVRVSDQVFTVSLSRHHLK